MKQCIAIAGRMLHFEGDEGDFYFQHLSQFAQGPGERHLLRFAERYLHPASTILDIGASIGLTTAALALACPKGHVYAFEPSPRNAVYLRRNLTSNALENATVVERAVGAVCSATHVTQPFISVNSAIVRERDRRPPDDEVASVAMETIDSWGAALASPVDFMKLNVGGYEAHVIAGAAETLVRDRPLIFMEFNSVAIAFAARRSPLCFAETIWNLFDVFEIDDAGRLSAADARLFVLNNMVRHGCVDDIVLDLKPGHDARSIREVLAIEIDAERAAAA
ncbi:FkbM family methyltransferase [Hyphomicrobium sp.]|uniref:FkbM family methyltransferase n=1 Tax=Hyphomicrobium sp. TaxID=82 RepID=UPI002D798ACA|nr:FkbM family methyltransferase [Hyphomicrobium sp.]HET6388416.1 FkbM family methyltransferase [Hyphomicrobium sp.]